MNTFIGTASGSSSATGYQKKRRFSGLDDTQRKFDPKKAPPLPPVPSHLILQIFTHKSLRRPGVVPDKYEDNERLAGLGEMVLKMEFTCHLLGKRPMLKAQDLVTQRCLLYKRGLIQEWGKHYDFAKKLVASADVMSKLDPREESVTIFYAYVGALFTSSGPEATRSWIDCLLSQEELTQPEATIKVEVSSPITIPPPQKRIKSEKPSPPLSSPWPIPPAPSIPSSRHTMASYHAQPPPSSSAFPYRSTKPSPPNPLAPAEPQAAFLPLFNQAAFKRKVTVEYLSEFSGPRHAGQWTMKCIVNGICKGEGTSSHKQTAKEEAARSAYYSMGWQ